MERPADLLRHVRHVVVFTDAGVWAESGVPTFRDALTGLWERFTHSISLPRTRSDAIRASMGLVRVAPDDGDARTAECRAPGNRGVGRERAEADARHAESRRSARVSREK